MTDKIINIFLVLSSINQYQNLIMTSRVDKKWKEWPDIYINNNIGDFLFGLSKSINNAVNCFITLMECVEVIDK